MAEELWALLGHKGTLAYEAWPAYDPKFIEDDVIEIPIMINGKVKSRISISADLEVNAVEQIALRDAAVVAALAGKKIAQKKYVPKKIFTIATD